MVLTCRGESGSLSPMKNGLAYILYQSEEDIRRSWNSIFQVKYPLSIYVVDNASTDGGPQLLRDAGVPVHTNEKNMGFTFALNQAIQHFWDTDIDWLFCLNPDCHCEPHWDANILDGLTSRERVGMIGTKQVDAQGNVVHSGGIITKPLLTYLTVFHELGNGMAVAQRDAVCPTRFRHRTTDVKTAERVSWVTFAAVALRMEMVREVGLLDNQYVNYCSDSKYAMQSAEKNWETWYQPKAVFKHQGGASMRFADSFICQQTVGEIKQFALEETQWPRSAQGGQPRKTFPFSL